MKSEKLLRNIYIAVMVLLFALIVSTPLLVRWQVTILSEELKEAIEAGMLFLLVIIAFASRFLYRKKLKQRERIR